MQISILGARPSSVFTVLLAGLLVVCLGGATFAQDYRHFEAGQVHPIDVSADGGRLYVCNTPDDRLAVFGLGDPSAPKLLLEIPVGLAPVTVRERTDDEIWVVSWLSDSVDIVSLSAGRVVASLRVPDEPADVVFAGGKAFVTSQASDEVHVFDAVTRASLATIPIFGRDPRSMVASTDGSRLWVSVLRSGNKSTIVPFDVAPAPLPPLNGSLGPAPSQGLIVADDDPTWSSLAVATVADNDLIEIDVATLSVTREIGGVGTILYDVTLDPNTDTLFVANLDSRNLVPFEPELQAHSVFSRITSVTTGATPVVTPYDLNPNVDYTLLPNPGAKANALAEPTGIVFDTNGDRLFVAAQGTDRIGVVDTNGVVQAFVELGAPGAMIDTRNKRGPRALALHPGASLLYVLNRLSHTITVIDTTALGVIGEAPIGFDPLVANEREGRSFLYDAKLSGNGTLSCAGCHIDGDWDGLAWDLGDRNGAAVPAPSGQPFPFNQGLSSFHPMKGPMTTQPLRGLTGVGPLHWRGDKDSIASFNTSFSGILGGNQLNATDLADFVAYLETVEFPPNPNQNLDRTLPGGTGANAADGAAFFETTVTSFFGFNISCAACHSLPTGTSGLVISNTLAQVLNDSLSDLLKVPHLRSVYRKNNPESTAGERKLGFGLLHDGERGDVDEFMAIDAFSLWPAHMKDDLAQFLLHVDTGTAPSVGHRIALNSGNIGDVVVAATLTTLEARALASDCDLVAFGRIEEQLHGLLYDSNADVYLVDDASLGVFTRAELQVQIASGDAELVVMGVAPGSGQRIALDRDRNGALNGVDGLRAYGQTTAGCVGEPRLSAPSQPRLGQPLTFVARGLQPNALGLLGIAPSALTFPALSVTLHIDVTSPALLLLPFAPDSTGFAHATVTVPNSPGLIGQSRFAQAVFADANGCVNWSATNGLETIFQP